MYRVVMLGLIALLWMPLPTHAAQIPLTVTLDDAEAARLMEEYSLTSATLPDWLLRGISRQLHEAVQTRRHRQYQAFHTRFQSADTSARERILQCTDAVPVPQR